VLLDRGKQGWQQVLFVCVIPLYLLALGMNCEWTEWMMGSGSTEEEMREEERGKLPFQ